LRYVRGHRAGGAGDGKVGQSLPPMPVIGYPPEIS
jgi:hypothetical protein